MFVHTEIGEVYESLSYIFGLNVVFVCCKSGQSLLEHIDSQRIIAGYKDVDAEIVLEVVY
jgi:hypothetical protein